MLSPSSRACRGTKHEGRAERPIVLTLRQAQGEDAPKAPMQTHIDEIADRIYRLSTFVPEIASPMGFTFNQFLIDADEPFLFHCGPRAMYPLISAAMTKVMPVERLRWIGFGHVESDECGAMNLWLPAAPQAKGGDGQTAPLGAVKGFAG